VPQEVEEPIKRKRGRPRKDDPKSYIKRTTSPNTKSIEKPPEEPPKRKRGRPPKIPQLAPVEKLSPQKGASSTPEKRDKLHLVSRSPAIAKETKIVKTPDTKFRENSNGRQEQRSVSGGRRKKVEEESDEEDVYKNKGPILKKELQKILSHQSWNQFDLLNASKMMGRVTRNSYNRANVRKGRKNRASQ